MTEPTPADLTETSPRLFPALTHLQEAFVHAYVANGGVQGEAARDAGYADISADVTASRLMRHPAVIKAIFDTTVMTLGAALPKAMAAIIQLSSAAKSEYVQLEASRDLLDRAGLAAPKKVNVGGSLTVSIDLG